MNIPAPTKPAESIPTEGNALAVFLVGFYRYEMVTARRAIEAHEEDYGTTKTCQPLATGHSLSRDEEASE